MIKLKKAEFTGICDNGGIDAEYKYRVKYKGFEVEYKHVYDYGSVNDDVPRKKWWIYDVKFYFGKKEITDLYDLDHGNYLNEFQDEINQYASEYIKERYKEFL